MRGEADSSIVRNRPLWQSRVKTDWCFDLAWRFEFESYGSGEDGENDKIGDSIQQIERWTTWREDLFNSEDKETLDNESREMFQSSSSGRVFRS